MSCPSRASMSTPISNCAEPHPHHRMEEIKKDDCHREKRYNRSDISVREASDKLQEALMEDETSKGFVFQPAKVDRRHRSTAATSLGQKLLPSPTINQREPRATQLRSKRYQSISDQGFSERNGQTFSGPASSPSGLFFYGDASKYTQSSGETFPMLSSSNLRYHDEQQNQVLRNSAQNLAFGGTDSSFYHQGLTSYLHPEKVFFSGNAPIKLPRDSVAECSSWASISPGGLTNGSHSSSSSESLGEEDDGIQREDKIRKSMKVEEEANIGLGIDTMENPRWFGTC